MLIVKAGYVRHNKRTYVAGEPLPDMSSEEENRLLDLGACVLVHDAAVTTQKPGGKKDPEGDEDPEGAKVPPEGDPEGDPDGDKDPESEDESRVELNINPEKSIKQGSRGSKK